MDWDDGKVDQESFLGQIFSLLEGAQEQCLPSEDLITALGRVDFPTPFKPMLTLQTLNLYYFSECFSLSY